MHRPVRLVVFDLDGTLVDSQATIVACAQAAFATEGLTVPTAEAIRRIVGLSLAQAMTVLLGRDEPLLASRMAEHYREAFFVHRQRPEFDEPLFPGVVELLELLAGRGHCLGIATGKAMRGLKAVLERHGLEQYFTTLQTADLHPSKPDPSMIRAALAEAGAAPDEAVMVGDTSYDILMARAAGITAIGVAWGNHPAAELTAAGADHVLGRFGELPSLLGAACEGYDR
jgi:phosphoglycolate phosphatase